MATAEAPAGAELTKEELSSLLSRVAARPVDKKAMPADIAALTELLEVLSSCGASFSASALKSEVGTKKAAVETASAAYAFAVAFSLAPEDGLLDELIASRAVLIQEVCWLTGPA